MARPEVTGRRLHTGTAATDDDRFLNAAQVRHRYADVSIMWIQRRLHDDSRFPKPELIVNGRRFWKISSLAAWERGKAAEPSPKQKKRHRVEAEHTATKT